MLTPNAAAHARADADIIGIDDYCLPGTYQRNVLEHEMKRLLLLALALNASAVYAQTLPDISAISQQQIFENWVQNRCIGKIADSKALKADAEASAAVWLEASNLPAENFEKADKVIASLLKEKVGGTQPGHYQVLKCSLIANSDAIRPLNALK